MQYPHEREERKILLGSFIDQIHKDRPFIGAASLLFGLGCVVAAITNTFLVAPLESFSLWVLSWLGFFFILTLSHFGLLFAFNKKSGTRFFNGRQRYLLKSLIPVGIGGFVLGIILAKGDGKALDSTALIWTACYALGLLSLKSFTEPSLRNLAAACLIIPLSCFLVLNRHSEISLNPYHLANIMLIIGLGIPHITYGMWMLLIKNR